MSLMQLDGLRLPSPIEAFGLHPSGVELYVKREDLIHSAFGGNKWRKLKYNLLEFQSGGYSHLVTFGGPFSNHIAAVAQACRVEKIPCVGLIRGTYVDEENPTLIAARQAGMHLIHITKEAYKQKEGSAEVRQILSELSRPFVVPEGGGNALGLKGCAEISDEIDAHGIAFDAVVVPAGTGTTAAGIIAASETETFVVNVLKNPSLVDVLTAQVPSDKRWQVVSDYHFGGFAKVNQVLVDFINACSVEYGFLLDPIYNGKGFYAVLDMMGRGRFPQGAKVLYILTGGLQGIAAYNYRCKRDSMVIQVG